MDYMKKTVRDIADLFAFVTRDFPLVILNDDIGAYQDGKTVFLVDEWVVSTNTTWPSFCDNGKQKGLLSLGFTADQAVFVSGFCMKNFERFLREAYRGIEIVKMGRNLDYALGVK